MSRCCAVYTRTLLQGWAGIGSIHNGLTGFCVSVPPFPDTILIRYGFKTIDLSGLRVERALPVAVRAAAHPMQSVPAADSPACVEQPHLPLDSPALKIALSDQIP